MKWIYSAVYVAATGFIAFLLGEVLPREWFNEGEFPYSEFNWEKGGKIYDRLKIKKWKSKLIDMSKIVMNMVPKSVKANATPAQLRRLVKETCVAEFVHLVLCLTSAGVYVIWQDFMGVVVWLMCVVGNIPFIMVQRYNRPHLIKLADRMTVRSAEQ